jgi:hypothetical protein
LSREIRAAAPKNVFLNLSGGGLGQLGHKSKILRDFEMRQVVPRKLPQLRVARGRASVVLPDNGKSERMNDEAGSNAFTAGVSFILILAFQHE